MAININIPIEDAVTDGSLNPVTSNAVFDALALKANSADLGATAFSNDYNDLDNLPPVTSGTVTSVGLTMPSAFTVANTPITSSGNIAVTGAGLANQYIRGDGTLATFPTSGGGGNNVNYYLNGGTAASVATYYQMSKTAVIGTGVDFSLAGNGLISQWLTDVGDPNVTEIPAGNWNFEMYFSASSSGGVPKFYVELLKYDGVTFTTIADNSITPKAITSGTTIDLYLTSVPVPLTSLTVGDRLVIRVYIVDSVLGRTIKHHTQDSHLCQVITTFSSGVSSINGLTNQTQYLAVGTAGTDFAINSATDTHTFNLPTANATNRGALSSVDWSTFNGKQNPITLTTTGTGAATFVANTLNIPTPSGGSGLTVGTTAITSGTVGRILFEGTGNVLQEDANLTYDSTLKRLTLKAVGTAATDIPFIIRNSANTRNIITVKGDRTIELIADTPATNGGISITSSAYNEPIINMYDSFGGKRLIIDTSNYLIGLSGNGNIKIGSLTTANSYLGLVTPTTNNRFLKLVDSFNNEYLSLGGNTYDGSGGISLTLKTTTTNGTNFVTFSRSNNTNPVVVSDLGYVGIGTSTLGARLDIRAQGALSTDIAFRVRNSADTSNLFVVKGNGVLNVANLPTSATGLVTGDIWNNLGILTIV